MVIGCEILEDVAVIRPGVRFDLHCARRFADALAVVRAQPEIRELRIDLVEVRYIDSAGLGMLLTARDAANRGKIVVSLVNVHGSARQALETSGLHRMFAVIR